MNHSDLRFFDILDDVGSENLSHTPNITQIQSQPLHNWDRDNFQLLLKTISNHPNWFRSGTFSIQIVNNGSRGNETILSYTGRFEPNPDPIENAVGQKDIGVRQFPIALQREDLEEVSDFLVDAVSDIEVDVVLNLTIDRDGISNTIAEKFCLDETDAAIFLWPSYSALIEWVDAADVRSILSDVFVSEAVPYHLFVEGGFSSQSDFLGFHSVDELFSGEKDIEDVRSSQSNYTSKNKELESRLSNPDRLTEYLSPTVFDTETLRETYTGCFYYSAVVCLSETSTLENNHLTAKNITYRYRTNSDINIGDITFESEELTQLYDLLRHVLDPNRGSISHWRQAVARFCSTFEEVPSQVQRITHYQGFLRDEAADEELEQAQDAIDDAIGLTQTLSQSISDATQSLSSNLQTVVFALLGAIVSNFVLILRYSDFPVLFPFSMVAIAGILTFYLPAIQQRINSTLILISNREHDFLLHFDDIRSRVGDAIYDFESLDNRRREYVKVGENAINDAQKTLTRVFFLLLLSWVIIQFYAFLVTVPSQNIMLFSGQYSHLQQALRYAGLYQGQVSGSTIQVTRTVIGIPAIWLARKFVSINWCSPPEKLEKANDSALSYGKKIQFYQHHPYLTFIALLLIIGLAVYEPLYTVFL